MTLYSSTFPLSLVARVFDSFLCEGWIVIYRTLLALLEHIQQELLTRSNSEQITSYMRKFQPIVDVESILMSSSKIPLEQRHIQQHAAEFGKLVESGGIEMADPIDSSKNFGFGSDATEEEEAVDASGLKPAAAFHEQQGQQQRIIEGTHRDVTSPGLKSDDMSSSQCDDGAASGDGSASKNYMSNLQSDAVQADAGGGSDNAASFSSDCTADGCPSIAEGMTEEEAMEIWMRRDRELARERQLRLQQEQQGVSRRTPSPLSDHENYSEDDEEENRPPGDLTLEHNQDIRRHGTRRWRITPWESTTRRITTRTWPTRGSSN